MTDLMEVSLLSPQKPYGNFSAKYVQVPGKSGYLGVGPTHAPFISELKPGHIQVVDGSGVDYLYFVSGGFIEILQSQVTIFADTFETPDNIDKKRAEAAEKRAIERLKNFSDLDISIPRALASLERAKARLALAYNQKTGRS